MYNFTDTNQQAGNAPLSLQTVFDGIYLDYALTDEAGSFTTLSVAGRSNTEKRIVTNEIPGVDGVRESDKATYEPKEITVKYWIKDKTNLGLRARLDRLNAYLAASKKELMFTDENNKHFIATAISNDLPEEESNDLIGTITFFCSDPFKYGAETEVTGKTANNAGSKTVSPIITVNFTAAASEYKITHSNGGFVRVIYSFVAGDVLVIDLEKRKVTVNNVLQMAAYDWKSKPFKLEPGANTFTILPATGATTKIKHKPRWI